MYVCEGLMDIKLESCADVYGCDWLAITELCFWPVEAYLCCCMGDEAA